MRTIKRLKQYQELEEIETVKSDRKCGGTLSCILQQCGLVLKARVTSISSITAKQGLNSKKRHNPGTAVLSL